MFWRRWRRRAPCSDVPRSDAPEEALATPVIRRVSWRSLLQSTFNHGSGRSSQERCPPLPEPVSMKTASPPARPRVVQGRPSVER
jgi:hypothetical protein